MRAALADAFQINSHSSAPGFNLCANRNALRIVAHPEEHLAATLDVAPVENLRVQLNGFELARINFDFFALAYDDFDVINLAAIAYRNRQSRRLR